MKGWWIMQAHTSDPLQAVIAWVDVFRIFAAVTGFTYTLAVVLALTVYLRARYVRVHRVLLGIGSSGITMVVALRLWLYPFVFGAGWALAAWMFSFIELVGLTAIIARDVKIVEHDAVRETLRIINGERKNAA